MGKRMMYLALYSFLLVILLIGDAINLNSYSREEFQKKDLIIQKSHIVSSKELIKELADTQQMRSENIEVISRLLGSPEIKERIEKLKLNYVEIMARVNLLSDAELEYIAKKANTVKNNIIGAQVDEVSETNKLVMLTLLGIGIIVLLVIILTNKTKAT